MTGATGRQWHILWGEGKSPTVRNQLEDLIDTTLNHGCKDFDSFPTVMKTVGVKSSRANI